MLRVSRSIAASDETSAAARETRALPNTLPLRHKHGETFAGAAGLDEFAHRQFVAAVTAFAQRGDEGGCAFRQNNVALEHDRVTGKMHRFLRQNVDKVGHMVANG